MCATPIGNMEDITYRAVRMLKEADIIAAEDTRHSRKLLAHYEIDTPLISYHEHNKLERGPELIDRLLAGENVVLISDAGVPGISDPGSHLVRLAVEAGIKVSPLPGPNAALSALVCSGIDTVHFLFIGFLPKTQKKRRELLERAASLPYTMIFYESPHRLIKTLDELAVFLGGSRQAAAGRELTKKFEEFVPGTLDELKKHFSVHEPRGEFTIVVAGNAEDESDYSPADWDNNTLVQEVASLVNAGNDKKQAMKMVAAARKISKRQVYQAVLEGEKK